MVKHYLKAKTSTFSKFNRFSKFVLLGNNIDGYVSCKEEHFNDFDEVIERLPAILSSLNYAGEWDIQLYQVPDDFRVSYIYEGRYRKPSKGRRVFYFSYMDAGEQIHVTVTHHLIHIFTKSVYHEEIWDEQRDRFDHSIMEESITVLLKEDLHCKDFPNDAYPGNYAALAESVWAS